MVAENGFYGGWIFMVAEFLWWLNFYGGWKWFLWWLRIFKSCKIFWVVRFRWQRRSPMPQMWRNSWNVCDSGLMILTHTQRWRWVWMLIPVIWPWFP
jgi:hypothetical protein